MSKRWPTRQGRWGVRQFRNGEPTGGGTVGIGWDTREEAEAANPPLGSITYEVYDRLPQQAQSEGTP